jgi:anti-sigma factor RsiW
MTSELDKDRLFLHALADQELDAATALVLERRIAAEPSLAAEYEAIVALKQSVKGLEKPAVSDQFAARIGALGSGGAVPPLQPASGRTAWGVADWRALAASVVVTAFLASSTTYMLTAPRGETAIEDAIANGHRRSLLAVSPIDIASSDRHTVRPWFDSKLGLSPPTTDLSAAGFPLVGGRIEVIGGNAVPTVVYRHNKHLITLVAIPIKSGEPGTLAPETKVIDGYNMVHWKFGGFQYWAVSDLDVAGLETFVDDLRTQ